MLREIILKSVTPSLDANVPHKRPLDASYYGGPVATSNDDEDVILSRGNVYRLLNGHWMLCQDGCIDCEPCKVQRNPLFTWILQKIKQRPNSKPAQHDLQLTIMPQANDHFHAGNLWPNYYVYVTPQGERATTPTIRTQHDNDPENPLPGLEDSFSEHHHRSKDLWRLTERDSNADRDGILQEDNRATVRENVSTEKTEKEESIERKHGLRNMRPRHQPQPRPEEKAAEEVNQLAPKLILGTDQKGQKHLVHVVPADYPTTTMFPAISLLPGHLTSSQFMAGQATRSNNTFPERETQTYQRIFRRVFDSLNTHRQSIDSFLKSPADNVDDRSSSMDNIEAARFSSNNRDVNHKNANFDPLHFNDALLSSFHAGNEDRTEKYQQYKNKHDEHIKQDNYYATYQDVNQHEAKMSPGQKDFNLDRQRRLVRIKPYFVNGKNILKINSSVSLPSLDHYSVNAIQKSDSSNGFVRNPAKQINLNDTFVEKANNNSIESNSITTKRENGQLFGSERLRSGDVNREFEASHHTFRVIVTTESPVIRSEHETLNRTTVLQITTSKTFANSL